MLELRSFDVCKNIIASIIVMLDCLEVDMKILNTDMETTGFNDYREISGDNGDTNGILVII